MALTGTRNQGSIPEREPEKRLPRVRPAAGAQIAQSSPMEAAKSNSNPFSAGGIWNGQYPNPLMSIHWRTSLVTCVDARCCLASISRADGGKELEAQ